MDRGRATAEDDPGGGPCGEPRHAVRSWGTISLKTFCLTNPAGDELGVLGTEVDHQDAIGGPSALPPGVSLHDSWWVDTVAAASSGSRAVGLVAHPDTPWDFWRDLPSVMERRGHHDLGLLELLDVHVTTGGHGGAQPSEQVQACRRSRWPVRGGSPRGIPGVDGLDPGASGQRRVEGGHTPVVAPAGGFVLRQPAASRSSPRRHRTRWPWRCRHRWPFRHRR